jgi:hypothetical protein
MSPGALDEWLDLKVATQCKRTLPFREVCQIWCEQGAMQNVTHDASSSLLSSDGGGPILLGVADVDSPDLIELFTHGVQDEVGIATDS